MENYNNLMDNEYNALVYGSGNMQQQQQHPMTSIPREISQNHLMHQMPVNTQQQSDIINLSYHQRDQIIAHDLPQQMGLYPNIPQIQQQPNHLLQQQHPVQEQQQQHPVAQNVNVSYSMNNINVNMNLDVQNSNDNYNSSSMDKESNNEQLLQQQIQQQQQLQEQTEDVTSIENVKLEIKLDETQTQEGIDNELTESVGAVDGEAVPQEVEELKPKEPEVDPNQCRVCKNTEDLTDIFAIENDMRICDVIMKICTNLRIHERDYLPHLICGRCVFSLKTAFEFKLLCEATDKELRQKLKRSKNKARKPSDFILIDCNEISESDDDEYMNDDEEFKVSDLEVEEEETDSGETTDDSSKKSKQPRKRSSSSKKSSSGGRKRSGMKKELISTAKRLKRDIVYIEANDGSSDDKSSKKSSSESRKQHICKECNKVCSSRNSLRLHRRTHFQVGEEAPFRCHICGRGFKYNINLTSHMQIHKDNYTCDDCGRSFPNKNDCKKHAVNVHKCNSGITYDCSKCRRFFCQVTRYQKHRQTCSDYSQASRQTSAKKSTASKHVKEEYTFTGRDLFKTVAPTTSTYWSDSFSD